MEIPAENNEHLPLGSISKELQNVSWNFLMKEGRQHFFSTHSDTHPLLPDCLGGTDSPRVPGCVSKYRAGAASEKAAEINQKDLSPFRWKAVRVRLQLQEEWVRAPGAALAHGEPRLLLGSLHICPLSSNISSLLALPLVSVGTLDSDHGESP